MATAHKAVPEAMRLQIAHATLVKASSCSGYFGVGRPSFLRILVDREICRSAWKGLRDHGVANVPLIPEHQSL